MKILHLSDDKLPDWRIEKSGITALNHGHEVVFAGKNSVEYQTNTFSKKYVIDWTERSRRGFPFYWHSVRKQVDKVVREARPDIVHAHNVFSAKIISELGWPHIYDNHEYWSEFSKILALGQHNLSKSDLYRSPRNLGRNMIRYFLNQQAVRLWTKWEKEIITDCPTITISDKIAEQLRIVGNSKSVFVVPNFPMKEEVKNFDPPVMHPNLSSVYAGIESQNRQIHRNIDGLTDLFNHRDLGSLIFIGGHGEPLYKRISYAGLLPRIAMFNEMRKHSIGLIPWKKHWSHTYTNPNKAYEYAHSGLFVLCTSSFETVAETLQDNCAVFDNYQDLASQLLYFKDNLEELYRKRVKIFEYSHTNLIWDNYEKNILAAYQQC